MTPRKHPRFTVNTIAYFGRDHRRKADMANLSLGGCCVRNVAAGVNVKGIQTLFLVLSGDEPPLRVDAAQLRWDAGSTFGLRFLFLERREQQRLEQHIARLASENKPVDSPTDSEKTPMPPSQADFSGRVARKAFELFERLGKEPGRDLENWLEAERLVKEDMCRETRSCAIRKEHHEG
jgi:hypothetical protein